MTRTPHIPLAPVREGMDWLLSCAPDPAAVQQAWDAGQLAAIPTGPHWRVAETQLSRSMRALRHLGSTPFGPVLTDIDRTLSWWLLQPSLADELGGTVGVYVHPAGWELHCPPVTHALGGRSWLAIPDGSGQLTDPAVLSAAFATSSCRTKTEATA